MHATTKDGVRIEYDVSGPREGPAIVLIMGLGMQLTGWPPSLVDGLVAQGFRVVRFDNRDAGLSSRTPGRGRPDVRAAMVRAMLRLPVNPAYTLDDMARDTIGLMDALGLARAHVVGASMGGMIAQVLAATHPARCASLTSIMSSSGAYRFNFHVSPATRALLVPPPRGADEERLIDHAERVWRAIGSPGLQPPRETLRSQLRANLRRAYDPAAVGRQMLAVLASGDRRPLLRRIAVPTLVLHGEVDPLVPIAAGRDTAANVPGARFESIPGMAHDLPEARVPRIVELLAEHCAAATA